MGSIDYCFRDFSVNLKPFKIKSLLNEIDISLYGSKVCYYVLDMQSGYLLKDTPSSVLFIASLSGPL